VDCLKTAHQVGVIPDKYEHDFMTMVRKRNDIVHIYNEPVAGEIYHLIISRFIEAIGAVVISLKASEKT